MLKLLVLLMIHDYTQRYHKIVTHYSLIPIVYMTGQKLTTWFLTPKNLSIYLFLQMYLLLVIMLMRMLAQIFMLLTILGIIMSSNFSFEQHIIELRKWCTGLCGWILRTFSSRESTVMMTLFKPSVLSRRDYRSQQKSIK